MTNKNNRILSDREYRSMFGMYGFKFIAEYINGAKKSNKLRDRLLALKDNFKILDECNKFLNSQKILLVDDDEVKLRYKRNCDRSYNELVCFFQEVDKVKIIDVLGEKKFIDIFLPLILIDMRTLEGEKLPAYLKGFKKTNLNIVVNNFIYSNFTGDLKVKSKVYKLYKKLYEKDYKERIGEVENRKISLKTGEPVESEDRVQRMIKLDYTGIKKLFTYIGSDSFQYFVDGVIPSLKYYSIKEDKDKLVSTMIKKLSDNFIYIYPPIEKNTYNTTHHNYFFEKHNLMTIPLYIFETEDERPELVKNNIYEILMDMKYPV